MTSPKPPVPSDEALQDLYYDLNRDPPGLAHSLRAVWLAGYHAAVRDGDERIRAVRKLLEESGCDCPCDHHPDERGDDCEVCLACRIGEAVGTATSPPRVRGH